MQVDRSGPKILRPRRRFGSGSAGHNAFRGSGPNRERCQNPGCTCMKLLTRVHNQSGAGKGEERYGCLQRVFR